MWAEIFKIYRKIFSPLPLYKGKMLEDLHFFLKHKFWAEKYDFRKISSAYSCKIRDKEVLLNNPRDFETLLSQRILKEKIFSDLGLYNTIIDCGAFSGSFTIFSALKVGPSGKVIAIEPQKKLFDELKANVTLNGLENVKLENKAIWRTDTTLDLNIFHKNASVFDLRNVWPELANKKHYNSRKKRRKIQTTTIDDLVSEYNIEKPVFIKLDIMGAEIEALEGMTATIEKYAPDLSLAGYYIRKDEETSELILRNLEEIGYSFESISPCGRNMVYAWQG